MPEDFATDPERLARLRRTTGWSSAEVLHDGDVGVVEGGGGAGFLLEACASSGRPTSSWRRVRRSRTPPEDLGPPCSDLAR